MKKVNRKKKGIDNMKVYKEYKEIELKDIKGVKNGTIYSENLEKVRRYRKLIKKQGIRKPFEVIQKGNEYYILGNRAKLLAAAMLGYDKIPCLIRDTEKEILLRKFNKLFGAEDENCEIKNNKKRLNTLKNNYCKLNIL